MVVITKPSTNSMKLERVLLVSDNNPMYYDFWNNLSYTYKEKFGISPTLIFFGTSDELKRANLSEKYGEIKLGQPVPNVPIWQYTWALFYNTKFYPNDTCAIMGIDQIPLGTYFLRDVIENVEDDNYVMLIDDQYKYEGKWKTKWDEGGYSPSAYHIAKGKTFNDVFQFEDTFEKEILKVKEANVPTMWGDGWGTDEAYSCRKLYEFPDRKRISDLSKCRDFLSHRIDCYRNLEPPYDINKLQNNFYIECHSCRPYSRHKNYLDNMFKNIPKFI